MASQINATVLSVVNQIVATGSVDGVCTTAAVLRHAAQDCGIQFAQAFTVDKVSPETWAKGRCVAFVDLAVNNRKATKPGETDGRTMTLDFVKRVVAAGHKIVAVCDEHNAADWASVLSEAGIDVGSLLIQPCSQTLEGQPKSSGALLLSVLEADEHTAQLCRDADAGDRMDFSGPFAKPVNEAVKSAIADDSRRVYLARHFAFNAEPDSKIQGWIAEYGEILVNHQEILAAREDLGDGIVRVSTLGRKVDVTVLMSELYKLGKVVVVVGEVFNPATKTKSVMHAFGVKTGDILSAIKAPGTTASGFANKANVAPEDAEVALATARAWLKAQA